MSIYYETNFMLKKEGSRGVAATIGFFDGVHQGHRYLLDRLVVLARENALTSMVITFANHPREVFNPDNSISLLSTNDEKSALIESLGIDKCLMLSFDKNLANLTSEQFLKILSEKYCVKLLMVGYDHHFGSDLNSTIDDYLRYGEKYGIRVHLEEVLLDNKIDISSSKIRKALLQGNLKTANAYLGYIFTFSGIVISGKKLGRTIGFPTANILLDSKKIVPCHGVYAVKINIDADVYIGMLNIGNRPTVRGEFISLEVHIIDYEGDLYGIYISLSLYEYIREEKKFPSKEVLKEQLEIDKRVVIDYFKYGTKV